LEGVGAGDFIDQAGQTEAAQYDFKLQVQFCVGNSLVHNARDRLLSGFLTTDCTGLFFVDSDISCGPGPFGRIVAHPADFVCGCYRSTSEVCLI